MLVRFSIGRMSLKPLPLASTAAKERPFFLRGTRPPLRSTRCASRTAWPPQAVASKAARTLRARSDRNGSSSVSGSWSVALASRAAKTRASMAPPDAATFFSRTSMSIFADEEVASAIFRHVAMCLSTATSRSRAAFIASRASAAYAFASRSPAFAIACTFFSMASCRRTVKTNCPESVMFGLPCRTPRSSRMLAFCLKLSIARAIGSTAAGARGAVTGNGASAISACLMAGDDSAASTTASGAGQPVASPSSACGRSLSGGAGVSAGKSSSRRRIVPGPTSPNCSNPSFSFVLNALTAVEVAVP